MKKINGLQHSGIYILFLFIVGFLTGVITMCLMEDNWLMQANMLDQNFIAKINYIEIDKRALLFLCMGKRLRAFFLICLLSFSVVNVFSTSFFFVSSGIYIGSIMEILAIRYGVKGLLFYLAMTMPQGIFYVAGFAMLGVWCLKVEKIIENTGAKKQIRVNEKGQLFLSFGAIILGILLESYVNPEIFLWFIKKM